MEALTAAIKINIHHVCPPLNGVLSVMGCSWSHTLLAHSEWAQEMLVWVDGWKKFPANSFSYKAHPWGITSTCFSNSSKQTGGLSVQFNSVTRLCPTLWDPMDCSMPGLPVHHQLPEFIQTHVHWVGDAIQTSHSLSSLSPIFPSIRVFSNESTLRMRWPKIGVSALASVLPMNTQDWSPLGWTGWTSLQSKGLSRVFSNTTVQKHQLFGAQLSL